MDDGICSLPAMIGTRMLAAGVDGSRWVSRSSKPLRGGLRCPGRVRLPRTPAMVLILNRPDFGTSKDKASRAASIGESYGCGACGETFATMRAAAEHAP